MEYNFPFFNFNRKCNCSMCRFDGVDKRGKGFVFESRPTDNHFKWRGWCSDVDNPLCCLECYRRPHCLQTPAVDMNLSISTPPQSIRTLVSSGGGKTFARTIHRNQTQGHVSRPAVRLDTKMGCQTLLPLQTLMSEVAQASRCDVWAVWGRRDFQTSVRGRGAAGRNKRQIQNFDGKTFWNGVTWKTETKKLSFLRS